MLHFRDKLVQQIENEKDYGTKRSISAEFELHLIKRFSKPLKLSEKIDKFDFQRVMWQRFKECEVFYDFIVFYTNFRDQHQVLYEKPGSFMEVFEQGLTRVHKYFQNSTRKYKIDQDTVNDIMEEWFSNVKTTTCYEFIRFVNSNPLESIIKGFSRYPLIDQSILFKKEREFLKIYKRIFVTLPSDGDIFQQCREAIIEPIDQKWINKFEKHKVKMENQFQKEDEWLTSKMDHFSSILNEIITHLPDISVQEVNQIV